MDLSGLSLDPIIFFVAALSLGGLHTMAQAQRQRDGFWMRMIFTSFALIWIFAVIGAMLGKTTVDKYLADADTVSSASAMPTRTSPVVINSAKDKQDEIDRSNNKNVDSNTDDTLVVEPVGETPAQVVSDSSTPTIDITPQETPSVVGNGENNVVEATNSPVSNTSATPSEANSSGNNTASASAESGTAGRVLFFGSFMQKETVDSLEARLEQEGVPYLVQEIPVEGGTAYRITSTPYATAEEANAKLEALKGANIEVYLDE